MSPRTFLSSSGKHQCVYEDEKQLEATGLPVGRGTSRTRSILNTIRHFLIAALLGTAAIFFFVRIRARFPPRTTYDNSPISALDKAGPSGMPDPFWTFATFRDDAYCSSTPNYFVNTTGPTKCTAPFDTVSTFNFTMSQDEYTLCFYPDPYCSFVKGAYSRNTTCGYASFASGFKVVLTKDGCTLG